MPHFITRQVFTGAGKVGTEVVGLTSDDVPFQLTQRADFFEEEVGLETTLKRPIVNTRDEPHADAQRYRRLHVIVGDANLSEVATFLKVGTTALVLAMIEDEFLPRDLMPAAPVAALRKVSYDLSLRQPLDLADGTTMTAVEMQWEYLDRAKKYAEEHGLECLGATEVGDEVLRLWEHVLTGLETDPMSLAAPARLGGQVPGDRRLPHEARPALGRRQAPARWTCSTTTCGPSAAWPPGWASSASPPTPRWPDAVTEPPPDTRAWFRGKCLQRWASQIVAANWDSMVFDIGGDPLRRVPMMDPTRGTEAHVGRLMAESTTSAELLDRLGQ